MPAHRLRIIVDEDPGTHGGEAVDLSGSQAAMTEDEQLAAAIAISMGEAAPPRVSSPSPALSKKSVSLTVDTRWSAQRLRDEISGVFHSMEPSMIARDDAMLYEAVSSNTVWGLEPMMFAHQHAYFCNAEDADSGCPGLNSLGEHLKKSRGMTAHVLAWVPPPGWPDPLCVDPVATWVARRETARPVQVSIAQLMDTSAENEAEEEMEDHDAPKDRGSQYATRPPSQRGQVEKLEHGVLLTAPYLDVRTLLLKIQEKTGIEPHNQLLLCVRQGYQKRAAAGQSGIGARENLAECSGRISLLIEAGVLSDEAELTVEVKQAGWRAGGGILSLAERAKAERERIDLIHVFCEDIMLTKEHFESDIPMAKGTYIHIFFILHSFVFILCLQTSGGFCGCCLAYENDRQHH